jgi:DNA-binding HxlR family transcriptional regulator
MSRSYGQYCGLARALDVVGDRWSFLIVRELLVGPARYSELLAGLPGVATNLLADRLRALEGTGVLERRIALDINTIVYALTPWGAQLHEPVESLIRWSTPLMAAGRGGDTFDGRWLIPALRALLRDKRSDPATTVGIAVNGTIVTIRIDDNGPHVSLRHDLPFDALLNAEPEVVLGLAAGALSVEQAISTGTLDGDPGYLSVLSGQPDR